MKLQTVDRDMLNFDFLKKGLGLVFRQILYIIFWEILYSIKVACRFQNSGYFRYHFIKNDIMFMHLLCIYKNPIILILFKIDRLNFTMYILTILTCSLKTCR